MPHVTGVQTTDTQRDISALINDTADRLGLNALMLLAGIIAESGLHEAAWRDTGWPDTSGGLLQPAVKWLDRTVPGLMRDTDGTVINMPQNIERARAWCSVAENVVPYGAKIYAYWVNQVGGDGLAAWCKYNAPSLDPDLNPNKANYLQGWQAAQAYADMTAPPTPTSVMTYEQAVETILATAQEFVRRGVPYCWGGETMEGADCSGLVMACFEAAGLSFPHFSGNQYDHSTDLLEKDALPGDLIFWFGSDPNLPVGVASHVALFIGSGQMIEEFDQGYVARVWPVHDRWHDAHRPVFSRPDVLAALPRAAAPGGPTPPTPAPTPTPIPTPSPPSPGPGTPAQAVSGAILHVVASDGLHLRNISSQTGVSLALLPDRTQLLVVGDAPDPAWIKVVAVVLGAVLVGFCARAFVTPGPA